MNSLVRQFNDFTAWHQAVAKGLSRYLEWLTEHDLCSSASDIVLTRARERLTSERLTVAFVAEFSRGKSELINAVFFGDYGQRMLPSAAGRTTMCPTELLWDEKMVPSIRLLPIETRLNDVSLNELREHHDAWIQVPLDINAHDHMLKALARVAETKQVSAALAKRLGLFDENDPDQAARLAREGMVEIPAWRHAVINFPHPLLQQGLVVLDTPGLNAIGAEPELTLNLIPNADAVVFILAADTGVTKSDIEIWRQYLGGAARYGRMVVLNKIDGLWDPLRSEAQIDAEIARQRADCADTLGIEADQVFPISAQKALVARVQDDAALLARSRIAPLEEALSQRLVPYRRRIVAEHVARELEQVTREVHGVLVGRARACVEQIYELNSVRGKNATSVERMLERIQQEKEDFDETMRRLVATRSVFARLSNDIYRTLGMDALRGLVGDTRNAMTESRFSTGLREAMREFLMNVRTKVQQAEGQTQEVYELMAAVYKRFSTEHAMTLPPAQPLRLNVYLDEIDRIEERFQQEFKTVRILAYEQSVLIQKFFETIATRVKDVFTRANRDVDAWLKSVMAPIESHTREHQRALRKRLHDVKRVHEASEELESRISELQETQDGVEAIAAEHGALAAQVRAQIFALALDAAPSSVAHAA
ncbi:MAG TPA: dynamin family protein [Burkholderiaceae bacterium]|nr:dynamin family protein [Burkholderiaceae bacterium]